MDVGDVGVGVGRSHVLLTWGTRTVQARAAAREVGAAAPGLIAVALFPTVHLPRDRHGLVMNTYGRGLPSLNNVAGL